MPWPTDRHLFIYFQTGAFIHVQVSIPECHGRRTGIFLLISGKVHSSVCRWAFPIAMTDGPAFISFFPARYIHPCPGEDSRMPWPMDQQLFIYFWTGAFIRVQVSIPECHGRWTCIYIFISTQLHPSMSQ